MIDQGPLFAVIEFGVGLAGFAGVAFALIHPDERAVVDRFRISNLLACALGAAFFALVPVLLDATGLSAHATWRITSGLLAASSTVGWVLTVRRGRAMSAEARAQMSGRVWAFNATHSMLAVALLVANVLGWPFAPQFAPVLFALFSLLAQAAINFVRIVSRFV
jgi:hypothetical protein